MLITFQNAAGHRVAVKAIDIMSIVQLEKDVQINNYPKEDNETPHYYLSTDSFDKIKHQWLDGLLDYYKLHTDSELKRGE
jgi:hypothetical protein